MSGIPTGPTFPNITQEIKALSDKHEKRANPYAIRPLKTTIKTAFPVNCAAEIGSNDLLLNEIKTKHGSAKSTTNLFAALMSGLVWRPYSNPTNAIVKIGSVILMIVNSMTRGSEPKRRRAYRQSVGHARDIGIMYSR